MEVQSTCLFHLQVERRKTHLFCLQKNSFDLTVLRAKAGLDFFYLQLGCLICLVALLKTELGVERVYSSEGEKAKMLFIILQIRSNDKAFYFSCPVRQRLVTFGALTQLGRGRVTSF